VHRIIITASFIRVTIGDYD